MSDDFWPKRNTETPHMPGSPKLLGRAFRPFAGGALLIIVVVAAPIAFPARAAAAPLPADTTAVISGTPDLLAELATPVSDSFAGSQSVSSNGSRVAFASESDGLVPGADPDVRNVYVKDLTTAAVTLVSRGDGPNGEPSHTNCDQAAISDDGNRVAFTCDGPLVGEDDNNRSDVYLRDLKAATTILVSREPVVGTRGDGDSNLPSIDGDGTHIAFTTDSTNFGDGAMPGSREARIYVRTLGGQNNTPLTLVSRADGANGADASGSSQSPSISADAGRVAFETSAPLVGATDNNGADDIYVRDLTKKMTLLESRAEGAAGAVGDHQSLGPVISRDGGAVAFSSQATNLDPTHDGQPDFDVYRRFVATFNTQLVSQTGAGVKGNRESFATGIDADGNRVAFITQSSNLDSADSNSFGDDIYVSTPQGILLASRAPGGAPLGIAASGALDGLGQSVAMTLDGAATPDAEPQVETVGVRRLDTDATITASRPAGGDPFVNQGGGSGAASVNADGRYVAFISTAHGLGLPAGVGSAIFVRDTVTGAVVLVSREDGVNGAAMGPNPISPRISADGRRVVFELNDGTDFGIDTLWLRDIPSGRTFRVDRADGPNGAPSNGGGFDPTISDDGSRVEFLTGATNLGDGDTDNQTDAHVRDLASGRTLLASRADGPTGAKANAETANAQISGNGGRVVFQTMATNLNDGDTSPNSDIHVRDLDSGDTLFVSNGSRRDGNSVQPSISSDGMHVSFLSDGSFGFDPPGQKLYLRDLSKAGALIVAGRADGPNGAPVITRGFLGQQISGDGNAVAFGADADGVFAPGAPADGSEQVYMRNVRAGVTALVSRRTGPAGVPLADNIGADLGGLTANGACVTFDAEGRLLAPPASADFSQVYLRALVADCGGRAVGASVLSPGAVDRVPPTLSHAKLSRKRFRIGRKPTALRARVGSGTVLSLRVSETASLTVTVDGQRVVRSRGRSRRVFRREGSLVRALKTGSARIPFSGRLGHRRLAVGRHRLTLVARDAAGNLSRRVTLSFTVLR